MKTLNTTMENFILSQSNTSEFIEMMEAENTASIELEQMTQEEFMRSEHE